MTSAYQQQLAQQLHAAENELGTLRQRVAAFDATARLAEADRDGAYRERAHLTAWLATIHPAVITPAVDIDEDGWQLLYITVGGRQLSWHIHPRDAELYAHVEHVDPADPRAQWDGHTAAEKYQVIRELTFAELRGDARAEQAEARIAAVRALADVLETEEAYGGYADANSEAARRIRDTLDAPQPSRSLAGALLAALTHSVRAAQDHASAMQKLAADLREHPFAVTITPEISRACEPDCTADHTDLDHVHDPECGRSNSVGVRSCTRPADHDGYHLNHDGNTWDDDD
ncbi:hypothetical protein [Kitasatospora sp. NPDC057738]|uniref:hypothetical protein n=1 Tax=Kitasatospora sp. NPDC057738 TaxID=3346233 RepID=UPI0036BA20C7